MKKIVLFFVCSFLFGIVKAQEKQFDIGMFGVRHLKNPITQMTYDASVNSFGVKTSQCNVLADDGFNVVMAYQPDYIWWEYMGVDWMCN